MSTKVLLVVCIVLFITKQLPAQFINAYSKVNNITGSTLSIDNIDESFDTYENGDRVLIIQVQDDVIGTTTNTINFGTVGAIQSAGLYEFATIASHTEMGGVPNSITLTAPLQNTYNLGPNSTVQVVSYPTLGTPNFTTTNNIAALPWNGNVGGIVAFRVNGTLTLNHNITADGTGFRGGLRSNNFYNGVVCQSLPYLSNNATLGAKGEGIYRNTNANFVRGRGHITNGGGGGNHANAGGGGGGNFSAGGEGGAGWNGGGSCPVGNPAGGLGGVDLSTFISANRLFFGGGGGGGQQNNSASTNGGNGGGLVIVQANELATTGTCAGLRISANGDNALNGGNDGIGGGGAGGTVLMNILSYNVLNTCPLTISANGGNGGSVNSIQHGGGGGGGQGAVIYPTNQPTNNINTTTMTGNGGCNNNSNPCNSSASSGQGTNQSGIIVNQLLPVELADFDAQWSPIAKAVLLTWKTASEGKNDYFVLEHSHDAIHFEPFKTQSAVSNGNEQVIYNNKDEEPFAGVTYYRIKQVDTDGRFHYTNVVAVETPSDLLNIVVYPNPTQNLLNIKADISYEQLNYQLYTVQGELVPVPIHIDNTAKLDLGNLSSGLYILRVSSKDFTKTIKVVLQ